MREFQAKKKMRRVLYSTGSLLALLALIGLMTQATWHVYQKEEESKQNKIEAEKQLADLEARQSVLNNTINDLQTPEGQDQAIRDKFQVAKPGEQVVVIVSATTSVAASTSDASALQKIWNGVVGIFENKKK